METQIKTFKADGRMGIALNMKSKAQNNWEYKIKNPFTIKEEKKTHTHRQQGHFLGGKYVALR